MNKLRLIQITVGSAMSVLILPLTYITFMGWAIGSSTGYDLNDTIMTAVTEIVLIAAFAFQIFLITGKIKTPVMIISYLLLTLPMIYFFATFSFTNKQQEKKFEQYKKNINKSN